MFPQEESALKAMLGKHVIPQPIIDAYSKIRAVRNKAVGGSDSPMGLDALSMLLVSHGVSASNEEEARVNQQDTDWDQVPEGTELLVQWQDGSRPATFVRRGHMGVIEFTLAGDDVVQCLPPFKCELLQAYDSKGVATAIRVQVYREGDWWPATEKSRSEGRVTVLLDGDKKSKTFSADNVKPLSASPEMATA